MVNKEEEIDRRISKSSAKVTKERRKKNTKSNPTEPIKKTERWFTTVFFSFLYYHPEGQQYSSTRNYPKVKLPRSRHK